MKETINARTEHAGVGDLPRERVVKEGPCGVMVFKLRSQGGASQTKGMEKAEGKDLVHSRKQRKVGDWERSRRGSWGGS